MRSDFFSLANMDVEYDGDEQYYLVPKHSERPETDESLLFVMDPCALTKVPLLRTGVIGAHFTWSKLRAGKLQQLFAVCA